MQPLRQQNMMRQQRQRKQQLYKMMLDQQVKYNQQIHHRQSDPNINYQPSNNPQFIPRRNNPRITNIQTKYLPVIEPQQRYKTENAELNRNRKDPYSNPEDKTQIYLSNCEQIIKNLRQLKNKRRQKSIEPVVVDPNESYHYRSQREFSERQYYPKPSFFSSGIPYNKNTTVEDSKKSYKVRPVKLKSIDQRKSMHRQIVNSPYVKQSVPKTNKKKASFARQSSARYNDSETKRELSPQQMESNGPTGIMRQNKGEDQTQNQVSMINDKSIDQHKEEGRVLPERQLVDCINELTRFLKSQNKNREEKAQNTEKVVEQPQEDPQKKHIIINDKIIQSQNQEEKQQPNSSPKVVEEEHHFQTLKQKAIKALKKVNEKSHKLLLTMQSKRMPKTVVNSTKQGFKVVIDSKQTISSHNKSRSQSPKYPEIQISPRSRNKENSSSQNIKIILNTKNQEPKKNQASQLVKQLMKHMAKQDNHNDQLTFCLKQLTEYLKNQNTQIQSLRNSRYNPPSQQISNPSLPRKQSRSPILKTVQSSPKSIQQNNKSKPKLSPYKQSPKTTKKPIKMQQLSPKEIQLKNQQSIIKKLKNARLRGNQFRQKMQVFRKKHPDSNHPISPSVTTQKKQQALPQEQAHKEQSLPEVQPNKQTILSQEKPPKQQEIPLQSQQIPKVN